jgi:hypothetical protein
MFLNFTVIPDSDGNIWYEFNRLCRALGAEISINRLDKNDVKKLGDIKLSTSIIKEINRIQKTNVVKYNKNLIYVNEAGYSNIIKMHGRHNVIDNVVETLQHFTFNVGEQNYDRMPPLQTLRLIAIDLLCKLYQPKIKPILNVIEL